MDHTFVATGGQEVPNSYICLPGHSAGLYVLYDLLGSSSELVSDWLLPLLVLIAFIPA